MDLEEVEEDTKQLTAVVVYCFALDKIQKLQPCVILVLAFCPSTWTLKFLSLAFTNRVFWYD